MRWGSEEKRTTAERGERLVDGEAQTFGALLKDYRLAIFGLTRSLQQQNSDAKR
ncbi:MAG TPA: hypothetical protein VF026_21725 [Ktedonobacteraceae bacterium]